MKSRVLKKTELAGLQQENSNLRNQFKLLLDVLSEKVNNDCKTKVQERVNYELKMKNNDEDEDLDDSLDNDPVNFEIVLNKFMGV